MCIYSTRKRVRALFHVRSTSNLRSRTRRVIAIGGSKWLIRSDLFHVCLSIYTYSVANEIDSSDSDSHIF